MNIHDDKTLYKLIAAVGLFIFAMLLIPAAINGGLKAVLFVSWLGIAFAISLIIAAFTIGKLTGNYSSGGFIKNYVDIWFDMGFYKSCLIVLFIIVVLASASVWNFLDRKIPDQRYNDLPVSEIPNSQNSR